MKKLVMIGLTGMLGMALTAFAQNPAPAAGAQAQGLGRGGAPFAWGDKNKDGICDVTGKPVGQGRQMAAGRMGRGGRWARAGRGGCCMAGRGAWRQNQPAPAQPQQQ